MIRYPISLPDIQKRVDEDFPNWRNQAKRRTAKLIEKAKYEETSSIWSTVKPIYMKLQYNKCIYCEQRLEGGTLGPIAHDLEHYRPKGNVREWPTEAERYSFPTGGSSEGYYRLAYHLGNYAASCKVCNSLLKSDFFPIAASRISGQNNPADYEAERPFLPYPLGESDENPEELLAFTISPDGPIAIPRYAETQNLNWWRRGKVTIDFFDLNRAGLREDRAFTLLAVWEIFKNAERGDVGSQTNLEIVTSPRAAHTNCARCFVQLCREIGQPQVEHHYLPILQRIVQINNA